MKHLRILGILLIAIFLTSFIIAPAQAILWANAVVESYNLGAQFPELSLGPPYPGCVPYDYWTHFAVRINPGGYLILDMGRGEEIPNGEGFDFKVEEVDKEDNSNYGNDPYEVWVSQDANTWFYLGDGSGDTQFDLAAVGLDNARYIKLGVSQDTDKAAEIDGVKILHPISNSEFNLWANVVVDIPESVATYLHLIH